MPTSRTPVDPDLARIGRLREGDLRAFEELYQRHAGGLLAFLERRCQGRLNANDVAQEVWLRVWRTRITVADGHFRGWLFMIARNLLKDEYGRKLPALLSNEFDAVEQIPHRNGETLEVLQDCLQSLGGEFIAAVRDDTSGLSTAEIATKYGISDATVYTRLSRGRTELRDCVKRKLT